MAKLNWQEDTPCQADHFSLLKLLKRSKNTKVMAILRFLFIIVIYFYCQNTPDLSSEGPYVLIAHGMKWPETPQIMCSGTDHKHTVLVGAIRGHLGVI